MTLAVIPDVQFVRDTCFSISF